MKSSAAGASDSMIGEMGVHTSSPYMSLNGVNPVEALTELLIAISAFGKSCAQFVCVAST
jgi:hypothetical protein